MMNYGRFSHGEGLVPLVFTHCDGSKERTQAWHWTGASSKRWGQDPQQEAHALGPEMWHLELQPESKTTQRRRRGDA